MKVSNLEKGVEQNFSVSCTESPPFGNIHISNKKKNVLYL